MDGIEKQPENLAYDLRQIYAKLVGDHLIDAAESRKINNFYNWFEALKDIKTITYFKWKDKEDELKKYNNKIEHIKVLANKYRGSWLGTNKQDKEISEIGEALRDLEEFIYEKISKLIGSDKKNPYI